MKKAGFQAVAMFITASGTFERGEVTVPIVETFGRIASYARDP
jgi:hypothetical protein